MRFTADHEMFGAIIPGDRQRPTRHGYFIRDDILTREYGRHRAVPGQQLREPSPFGHQAQRVIETEYARDASRRVFAKTVT